MDKPNNALSTNELWERFYMYERHACDVYGRDETRAVDATLANAVARLLAAKVGKEEKTGINE